MLRFMAKKRPRKRPDSKRSLGVDRHTQPRIAFHMPQALYDAFKEYVKSQEPEPNESAILRLALQRYLASVGAWPPPRKD